MESSFRTLQNARAFFEGVSLDIPQSTWSNVIAGLRGWSNVYRLRGASSRNLSRKSGCKCC